ncbi:MAG: hypothetical protein QMD94_01615 [Candidatus Omnitrophota bacterium]|nr:hypothetical protein [Candidatus Omnitrophota bacterium]
MKDRTLKIIVFIIFFAAATVFAARFAGANILKFYIESSIGNCQKIPILCLFPQEEITLQVSIDKDYIATLIPYESNRLNVFLPKGFTITQETSKKIFYEKKKKPSNNEAIYLFRQEPFFFINLFPEVKKFSINNNYDFIKRTLHARLTEIKTLNDAFFVIMKSIFIPDLGSQENTKMAEFNINGKKGFLNYNLSKLGNYFDCNIIDDKGNFFKIYIKDKSATLSLSNVLTITSTLSDRL